jgi:hypothetical protein
VQLEVDRPAVVLERDPAPAVAALEADAAEDERAVGVVLELVVRVDSAADPDVTGRAGGEGDRLRDRDVRRRREQASDAKARTKRPENGDPCTEQDETQQEREKGSHGADHRAPDTKGPEGTYPTRGR